MSTLEVHVLLQPPAIANINPHVTSSNIKIRKANTNNAKARMQKMRAKRKAALTPEEVKENMFQALRKAYISMIKISRSNHSVNVNRFTVLQKTVKIYCIDKINHISLNDDEKRLVATNPLSKNQTDARLTMQLLGVASSTETDIIGSKIDIAPSSEDETAASSLLSLFKS